MTVRMPSEQMQEGIQHALRKSAEHLSGAEALISINNLNDAVVLIEFAIEEFGRAVVLREKLKTGSEEIEKALFTSHNYKYEKAWSVLPNELKTIYEGAFDPTAFHETYFDVGETISPRARLDATFVNYNEHNKKWKVGISADKEKLEIIIKDIRKRIESF